MSDSADLKMDTEKLHVEELKKYRHYNYREKHKPMTELLKDIQRLWEYSDENPPNLKLPEAESYSLVSDEIEAVEMSHSEYEKIIQSSSNFPYWFLFPAYLLCTLAAFHLVYGGNWNDSISNVLSGLFLSAFVGAVCLFPVMILLRILWIPIDKIKIAERLLSAKISKEDMSHYEWYKQALYSYIDDLANYLIREKEREIAQAQREIERTQRKKEEYWRNMDGHKFEREIESLLRNSGHVVIRTKGSGDMGVDLILDENTIVQCKATKSAVSPSAARDLFGTMNHFKKSDGILISTGGFTSGTKAFCRDKNIELWDLGKIVSIAEGAKIE